MTDPAEPIRDFGYALRFLKAGRRVTRAGWNGKGMWLRLAIPEDELWLPYIIMSTVTNQLVPWLASQTDMLAEDWIVLEDEW